MQRRSHSPVVPQRSHHPRSVPRYAQSSPTRLPPSRHRDHVSSHNGQQSPRRPQAQAQAAQRSSRHPQGSSR